MNKIITIAYLLLITLACSAQEKKTSKFGTFLKKVSTAVTTVSQDSVTNENSGISQERRNAKFNASSMEYLEKSKEARNSYDNLGKRTIKSAVLNPNEKTTTAETKPKEATRPAPTIDIDATLTEYDKTWKLEIEYYKKSLAASKKMDQAQTKVYSELWIKEVEIHNQLEKQIDSNKKAMTDEQKARLESIVQENVKLRDESIGL